jgi:hypothetical protein
MIPSIVVAFLMGLVVGLVLRSKPTMPPANPAPQTVTMIVGPVTEQQR